MASGGTAAVTPVLVVVACALRAADERSADRALTAPHEPVTGTATVLRRTDDTAAPHVREVPVADGLPGDVVGLGLGCLVRLGPGCVVPPTYGSSHPRADHAPGVLTGGPHGPTPRHQARPGPDREAPRPEAGARSSSPSRVVQLRNTASVAAR